MAAQRYRCVRLRFVIAAEVAGWVRVKRTQQLEIALLLAVPLGVAVAGWQLRWTHDDGFITFRVVEQFLAGHGPVYNQGQRVEAFSSPVHVALLATARALTLGHVDVAWLSATLTIAAMSAGIAVASFASVAAQRAAGARGDAVPFGAIMLGALWPMWEYATSGLETGLVIGWIGAAYALMLRRRPLGPMARRGAKLAAIFVGLGPLVRPELTILTIGYSILLVRWSRRERRPPWPTLAWTWVIPLAYQVFRMGYYGSIVANTALANQGSGSRWDQGWYYTWNFVSSYAFYAPVLLLVAWSLFDVREPKRRFGSSAALDVVVVTVGSALVHLLYVIRLGGDDMHARMLLPVAFTLACPWMAVVLPRTRRLAVRMVPVVVIMVAWGAASAALLRPSAPQGASAARSIVDQRHFFVVISGSDHPVSLDDWRSSETVREMAPVRAMSERGDHTIVVRSSAVGWDGERHAPLPPGARPGVTLVADDIGVAGLAAGLGTYVEDVGGLASPIASRLPPERPRGLPDHETVLTLPWLLADVGIADTPERQAAASQLQCGSAAPIVAATSAPLTPGRFLSNLVRAPSLTLLRLDPEPAAIDCR